MVEEVVNRLRGRRILVVEDEYIIAADLTQSLEDFGVSVIGPAGSVTDALALVIGNTAIDAAVLDINLSAEKIYPVAAALREQKVPFVFATGYDRWVIPDEYADIPRLEKPVDIGMLARALAK